MKDLESKDIIQAEQRRRNRRWVRLIILAIGIPTTLCFLFAPPLLRKYFRNSIQKDRAGIVVQQDTAVVEILASPGDTNLGNPSVGQVVVRYRGQLLPAKEVVRFVELHRGKPARITYVVGHSGRIYIDRVEP